MTQNETVLKHLRRRTITSFEAFDLYNITRLASVVQRLKKEGHRVKTVINPRGRAHYAIYKLEK